MTCSCCGGTYTEDNDLEVFGQLIMDDGRHWLLCGPCISWLWANRKPPLEPVA